MSATAAENTALRLEYAEVVLSSADESRILRAARSAKKIGSATVIVVFRNGKFSTADVSKHCSRVE